MAQNQKRILRISAVQTVSQNGQIKKNFARALPFVEKAAENGAKIILLPEFMPTGYDFTANIWEAAESREGFTVQWLKKHAKRLKVYIGTTFLEAAGEDFYNTFVLAAPDGSEAGYVRKQIPAAFEAFFMKGATNRHVIDTEVGRIGIAICYESILAHTPRLMNEHSVDLLLMPHSAPLPAPNLLFPRDQVVLFQKHLREITALYAGSLGIPAVMANKCGKWENAHTGLSFLSHNSSFAGLSTIADSDGIIKDQMDDSEGIITADVLLDPSRKMHYTPKTCDRWFGIIPWPTNFFPIIQAAGRLWYKCNALRKSKAREMSMA